ncbi:MAG: hypothetical protein KF749_08750 [Bacteroidetes bacterium]|nr:hypothetical protein [Bacteroidota bacterium]MCW5895905.1 hypothetical protein [Bacteroidota bacterium]
MKYLSLLLVAGLVFFGCAEQQSAVAPDSQRSLDLDKPDAATQVTYQYVGYARDGSPIVRGQLVLSVSPANVRGNWRLASALNEGRIGPQIGRGILTGSFSDGILNINLNPNNADNNVLLSGRFDRNQYIGQWKWVGFRGLMNGGTFEAHRVVTEAVAE